MRALLLGLCFLVVGCKERNPNYCEGAPMNLCPADGGDTTMCTDDSDCMTVDGKKVCNQTEKMCVQCTAANASACTGTTPLCTDDSCVGCTKHSDCPSKVCISDGPQRGACAEESMVAYVEMSGTDSGMCTSTQACRTIGYAVERNKMFVKVRSNIAGNVLLDSKTATIFADPGVELTPSAAGPVVEIRGTSDVTIHDLTIKGGTGGINTGHGISIGGTATAKLFGVTVTGNQGRGIQVNTNNPFTLERSTVSQNDGGGLDVIGASRISVINNFIVRNGEAAGTPSTVGGANVAGVVEVPQSRFAFNTVVHNENGMASALVAGISCQVGGLDAGGNIAYFNIKGGTNDMTTQLNNGCSNGNTYASAPVTGNLGFDLFGAPPKYKLVSDAPMTVRDVGATCPMEDFDRQRRPFNNACDLGADEYHPTP